MLVKFKIGHSYLTLLLATCLVTRILISNFVHIFCFSVNEIFSYLFYEIWLIICEVFKKIACRKVFYKFPDGQQIAEEYSMATGVV